MMMTSTLPPSWARQCGVLGQVLADALPELPLEVVRLVRQYLAFMSASADASCRLQPLCRFLSGWSDFDMDASGRFWLASWNRDLIACYEDDKEMARQAYLTPRSIAAAGAFVAILHNESDRSLLRYRCVTQDDECWRVTLPHHMHWPETPFICNDVDGTVYVPLFGSKGPCVLRKTLKAEIMDWLTLEGMTRGALLLFRIHRDEIYALAAGDNYPCYHLRVFDKNGKRLRILLLDHTRAVPLSLDFNVDGTIVVGTKACLDFYAADGTFLTSHRYLYETDQHTCDFAGCKLQACFGTYSIPGGADASTKDTLYCVEHHGSCTRLSYYTTRQVRVHPNGSIYVLEAVTGSLFVFAFVDACWSND